MGTWADRWTGRTIADALAAAVERYGDREMYVCGQTRLTFRDVQAGADRVARAFLQRGVKRGDRVGIWMAGYPEWTHLYFGLTRIGAIIVPLNTRYQPSEMEYVLQKARVQVLVFRDEVVGGKDYRSLLLETCPEIAGAGSGEIQSERLPWLRTVIAIQTRGDSPGIQPYDGFLAAGETTTDEDLAEATSRVASEDIGLIQFTSGTTAFPKGAQLVQVGMLRGADYNSQVMRLNERDRFFSPQPFYHVGGSIQVMLAPVVCGLVAVVQSYFDPSGALDTMEAENCNATMGHQPHYIEYINDPRLGQRHLHIEKASIFAPPDVNHRVAQLLKIPWLVSPYGMTETHLGGTGCREGDSEETRLDTVGKPHPGVEMLIRDPVTGGPAREGEPGEICFRGWCVMRGYVDDPERTAEAVDEEGWFRTGDLGVLTPEGNLRLVGRIKDVIRVGGENLAAADVEAIVGGHPAVKQVVALGRPEPRLGEVVVVFVELRARAEATEADIIDYCRGRLASFKIPRAVYFLNEWPMSGTGKIHKVALRERVLQESSSPA